MGKRGRRKRREGSFLARPGEALRAFPDAIELSEAFWSTETPEEFALALEEAPALLSDAYLSALRDAEHDETGIEPLIRVQREVLELALGDRAGAWEHLTAYRAEVERLGVEIDALTEVAPTTDFRVVLEQIDALHPQVAATGMMPAVGHLHGLRGEALMRDQSQRRPAALEAALEELDTSRVLADDDNEMLQRTMQIGIALAERLRGDRAENIEQAIGVLREAVQAITTATPTSLASTVRTNLATVLLRRERGDRGQNLRDARDSCLAALEVRSPDKNVYDWAHTQLNLAEVLRFIAEQEGRAPDDAAQAYEAVVAKREWFEAADLWLVGAALFGLGDLARDKASISAEDHVEAHESGVGEQEQQAEERRLNEQAIEHLEAARPLLEGAPDQLQRARLLTAIGDVNSSLDRTEEAVQAASEANELLAPTQAPDAALKASSLLGGLRSDRGEWSAAADAYTQALEASELIFQSRLETADREREAGRAAFLARWGAFAMAQTGDVLRAALALDGGRARELHRRTGLRPDAVDAVEGLPDEIRQAYRAAAADLRTSSLAADTHAAGRYFQEVVAAIREVAGDEALGGRLTEAELAGAVADGWPLLYINPTPWGTLLLTVEPDGETTVAVNARCLEGPTALEVLMFLMAGHAAIDGSWDEEVAAPSYWGAASGHAGPSVLQAALVEVLPWFGEHITRPAMEMLEGVGYSGITLVPCGPIAAVPLHACSFESDGGASSVTDHFAVRYAPSAPLAAVAIERADERREQTPVLVGLADPNSNLPSTQPELAEIAKHFSGGAHTAVGSAATSSFLRRHIDRATHVHLACHAAGNMFDIRESGVALADGVLPAIEFTGLGTLGARLVTISACQSAVVEMRGGPEEVISIGTATLAAGAACAVASLWPVEDRATALLMTKLYDGLIREQANPAGALRAAASWLRELTENEEQSFLRSRPALAAELARLRSPDEPALHPRGLVQTATPYAHPSFWAGFIAVGA